MNMSRAYDKLMAMSASKSKSPSSLRLALANRVVIADGAMGTMLQAANPSLEDFQGHEGCNEVLNITRPELVAEPRAGRARLLQGENYV